MKKRNIHPGALASAVLTLAGLPGLAVAQQPQSIQPPYAAPQGATSAPALTLDDRLDAIGRQMEAINAELARLRAENAELRARVDAASSAAPGVAAAPPPPAMPETTVATNDPVLGTAPPPGAAGPEPARPNPAAPQGPIVATLPSEVNRAEVFGYGELAYNAYRRDKSRNEADLRRAVFGIGYRFDEDTRFISEFEIEHAVTSSSDAGEFEVEQFYIDHRITDNVHAKAGLMVLPLGYINTVHEPPRYFGVERNFVETAIIPTTEREGGAAVYGTTNGGLAYDVGITTGFNLAKWDFASDEGRDSPFGSVHQELSLARAADPAFYGALNYNGIPGYNAGASVFTGKGNQNQPNFPADPRFTLWEAHTRWTPGRFDLSALYAEGRITDTAGVNLLNVGQPTPIPERFYGWFLQGAYRVWEHNDRSLVPFVRYERFDTGARYAALPPGLAVVTRQGLETVGTFGASFYLNPNVVIKADYQAFRRVKDNDRFNLGLGFMF